VIYFFFSFFFLLSFLFCFKTFYLISVSFFFFLSDGINLNLKQEPRANPRAKLKKQHN